MPFHLAPYDSCGFCAYVSREVDCAIIAEDDLAMAFVNHRQYEHGAALVIPKQHRETVQNNGITAGQHVPHMHVHVVPRFAGSDAEKLPARVRDHGHGGTACHCDGASRREATAPKCMSTRPGASIQRRRWSSTPI